MAALRKGLGRKRRLDVWTHFRYLDAERKTLCLIVSEEGKQCGHKIGGKNTTNLKRHIRNQHKEIEVREQKTTSGLVDSGGC